MKLKRGGVLGAWLLGASLLFVPDLQAPSMEPAEARPFVWGQDSLWEQLEARYLAARRQGCSGDAEPSPPSSQLFSELMQATTRPDDPGWARIERLFFEQAAHAAACPTKAAAVIQQYELLRQTAKGLARDWPTNREARDRLYRLLYGARMALEEVLLQMPPSEMPVVVSGRDEPSSAPSATVHGIRVHSGDILVSRGGAPTSALIARGNDYPGNFSHVALVHVADGRVRTIEAHIEVGVVVADLETYIDDPKLRVMLLRPRSDPAQPELAHRAAEAMLHRAQTEHIPYDFAMDHRDHSQMFCSEVASAAYATQDLELWKGLTTTSAPGTARWLSAFGVRHAVTHGPSDLEYDPALVVVAEWRSAEGLFGDHIDNAVSDALLERAASGVEVGYAWQMLPVARGLKALSWLLNQWGAVGPIPEGMSATVALRVDWLREQHRKVRDEVTQAALEFQRQHGYRPPFWRLSRMASEAAGQLDNE